MMCASLADRVAALEWYHTIDLGEGVITPGWFDHRPIVGTVPLPSLLAGRRCLDVGTFNGFWAFEMERRGAAEVLAVDVLDPRRWDWPADSDASTVAVIGRRLAHGEGFEIARAALGSRVRRLERSVYELDPDEVGGFDLAYVGSLLVHLRDPVGALERIRRVAAEIVVVDGIDLPQTLRHPRLPLARLDGRGRPWWWQPNLAGLRRMVEAAGFELLTGPRLLFIPRGAGGRARRAPGAALRSAEGRREMLAAWLGDPHGALRARRVV